MRGTRPSGDSDAVNSGEVARQDTEAADAGNSDDEYISVLEATGTDEFDEAVFPPDEQPQPPGQADAMIGADSPEGVADALEREVASF
jgi:hypothetical protein